MGRLGALEKIAHRLEHAPRVGASFELSRRAVAAWLGFARDRRAFGGQFKAEGVAEQRLRASQQLLDERELGVQARLALAENVLDRLEICERLAAGLEPQVLAGELGVADGFAQELRRGRAR